MKALQATHIRLYFVITLCLTVWLAQNISRNHEIEHAYHDSQELCFALSAFSGDLDLLVSDLDASFDSCSILSLSVLGSILLPPSYPLFSIRAPPAYFS